MKHLLSIIRQPLESGGFIETGDDNLARAEILYGDKSEDDLREISKACLEAADQIAAEKAPA